MNSRGQYFKVIIEKNDTANDRIITKDDIQQYLNNNISGIQFYAFIEHNCEKKTPHYHLFIKTYTEYSQKSILNDIAKSLLCNINAISVRISRDIVHDVRYLTHKDDYEKWQYGDDEVTYSNFMDYDDIVYKQINIYELDFESLYNIIQDCNLNKIAIYSQIGLKNAKNYKLLIDEIILMIKRKARQDLEEKLYKQSKEEK